MKKLELINIESELEKEGFEFEDGVLGGVGSGGGGYYDDISDRISGFNLDTFNQEEFNKWYDNFSLNSFNTIHYTADELDKESDIDMDYITHQFSSGFYRIGEESYSGGFVQIHDNNDITLYANPTLTNNNEFYKIFDIDSKGNIIKCLPKNEVINKLKENLTNPDTWAII